MKEDQWDSVRAASVEVLERPPIRQGQRREHALRLRPMCKSEQRSAVTRSFVDLSARHLLSASSKQVPADGSNDHEARRARREKWTLCHGLRLEDVRGTSHTPGPWTEPR